MNAWKTQGIAILRIALGLMLAWAGVAKLGDPWKFAEVIANFRLLPPAACQVIAVTLPWVEIGAGLLLVTGIWVRASALLAVMMLAAFFIAVATALIRGLDIDCGCFGPGSKAGWLTLAIDLAGIIASVLVIRMAARDE